MSLSTIPYQPLPFDLTPNCTLPCANWIQKIERDDITSVQFRYGACGTAGTIISNGDFASDGTDWTQNGTWTFNGGVASSPIGSSGFLDQVVEINTGISYVELTVNVTIDNGTFVVSTDNGYVNVFYSTGSHTMTIPVSGDTDFNFFFPVANGGSISLIIVKPINTNVRMDVVDLDNNIEATIPTTWFTYSNGFLTANFEDWDSLGLADGCYKLAVYDPCECSQFGFVGDDFNVPNQFRLIAGSYFIDVANGYMYSTGGTSTQTQVRSRALLCPDVDYEITYTVTGLDTANGDSFQIRIGTTNGTVRTVDGTYTETLSTSFAGDIEVRYIFDHGTAAPHAIGLNDFSIEAVTPIVAYYSEKFYLKDDHSCTVLVEACGVAEEFNFGFIGTGFKPIIRLEGTYRTANYPTTRTEYEYSTGEKNVPYMRTRQAKTLLFGAPEYIQDFARLWLGLTNVYIDGLLKFCEDSEPPTVAWEEDVDLGVVTYTFSPKVELTEKRSCTTLANDGCSTEGYAIAIESSGGFKLGLPVLATQGKVIMAN